MVLWHHHYLLGAVLKVNRFANALIELGVQKGDRIGLLLPNCPQFVISLGLLSVGAIVTNMNPMYTTEELKNMAEITGNERSYYI